MNYESIIPFLAVLIVILFLLFSVFLLFVKTRKKLSNQLLAAFLIITAIDISAFFYSHITTVSLNLDMLRNSISAFKNPLLFLYILSLIYSNFKLKWIHLIHVLPWIITIIILLPNFFLVDVEAKMAFIKNYDATIEIQFLNYFGDILSLAYLIAEFYYIHRYRKLLLENFTDKRAFKNYNWLKQLAFLLLIGQVLTQVKNYARVHLSIENTNSLRTIVLFFGVFFICWLFLKAVNSPKLFKGVDVALKTSKELKNSEKEQEIQSKISYLKEFMVSKKPYLNPSLTIRNLAEELKINSRDLSVLINQHLNQHFFDFVNEYRIKEAQEILKKPAKKKFTILEILYEVGFNSKSSFNSAFKKHTGLTPTQFRKTHS
ncbi:helix-turn-helix domain-containing protein [Polaribacter litorisediminis]|uniref:helix-turn-helix domain-containing protein n=1 Tax=Polaribacter litorisediminis TaxID=1908341 RepID=UPI001CBC70C4|nr:helix-turn-helix domain-containing protein [Polaribacter litorisediminis]UAM97858.1 helix-turn-helix domain-containing protein [Polaribacter litorisediminis]